jgi:pimeloyl-ACP methyl ester carboxylesterase
MGPMDTARPAPAAFLALALTTALCATGGCARPASDPHQETTMQHTRTETGNVLRMQAERVGSGPPLVLIGGGLTGWASWIPHAERLAATRQVTRLQLLAVEYGLDNRPLPDGYSVRMESAALAAALDEAGTTEPLDLVAWSYGALVTLDFALAHPERVRTLTLIEPPAVWTLPGGGRSLPDLQTLSAVMQEVEGGDDVSVAALVAFLRIAALVPPGSDPATLPQWESWVRHRRSLRSGSAPFRHVGDPERLRAFHRPVLLVTGHGTSPFLRAVHDALAATLPDGRTLELPGGHAPQLAAMDAFLAALARFHAGPAARSERPASGALPAPTP